jgi:small subunit ribosomal protein S3
MSVVKHFIEESIKRTEIDEFLRNEFERAGYGGVNITKTPLGTHLVIYTMRPGLVIGRGGETIRALATVLEEQFQLPNPQISVAEIEIPELNAYVVASKIASALKRGVHYRRAGFWGLTQAMSAGALGIEVIISGKLRTDRARYEKFSEGYLPKSGEPPRKYMRKAELHVQMKPGILGVKVQLMPPDAQFPDHEKVHVIERELASETTSEIIKTDATVSGETTSVDKEMEKVPELTVSPAPEKVIPKQKATEPDVPNIIPKEVVEAKDKSLETKVDTKEKISEPAVPKVEKKEVTKKVAKAKASSTKQKVVVETKIVKATAPPTEIQIPVKKAKPKPLKSNDVPVEKKEKVVEPELESTPAKEKKVSKKKVVKAKVSPTKEDDEVEE